MGFRQRRPHGVSHLFERQRLADEAGNRKTEVSGLIRTLGKAGHQQNLQVRSERRCPASELQAVHSGHLDVGQQEIEFVGSRGELLERFGAIRATEHLVAIRHQGPADQIEGGGVIVCQKYPCHLAPPSNAKPMIGSEDALRTGAP